MNLSKEEKLQVLTMHLQDNPLKYSVIAYQRALNAAKTKEIEETFKLSEKTIGHQYLLLLGLNRIDTDFHATNPKGNKK